MTYLRIALPANFALEANLVIDPGYMSRKIRMFRTDKFDARSKRKFL